MASFTLQGIPVSRGIAIGRAHVLHPAALDVEHFLVAQEQVEAEVKRLQDAIAEVHRNLQELWTDLPKDAPTEFGTRGDILQVGIRRGQTTGLGQVLDIAGMNLTIC